VSNHGYVVAPKHTKIDPMRFRSAFAKAFDVAASNKATGLEKLVRFINADHSLTQLQLEEINRRMKNMTKPPGASQPAP